MDMFHQRVSKRTTKSGHKAKRKDDDALKVVYISTPMKVRTSTARFRTLVQQLTGKNSDIAQYMEVNGAWASEFHDDDELLLIKNANQHQVVPSSISSDDTTTSMATTTTATTHTTLDSYMGHMDNVFTFQMEEQFFSSESSCHPSQLDVLGSYDDLI